MAIAQRVTRKRQRRTPGYVNGAVALAVLVVVATVAITTNQVPSPAIAELSPSAVQQIVDAPIEQTSDAGLGAGGAAVAGGATTSTTGAASATGYAETPPAPAPIERARVRRCVGDPPRQIEDPQSPPCVPYWQGDNGGATYQGVTAEEIVVVVPGDAKAAERFEAFFNKRFEFYGRRLRLVPRGGPSLECSDNKATATEIDEVTGAFAALGLYQGNEWCYQEELARRQVVGVTESVFPEEWLAARHPYLWQYPSGVESLLAALGQWTCARLAGGRATFADGTNGAQLMATVPRSFGLLLQPYGTTYTPDPEPLERELARCGARLDETVVFPYGVEHADASANAVLRMKAKGITTAYCLCTVFQTQYLPPAATTQGWFPEWVFSSFGTFDSNLSMKGFWPDAQQRQNVIGITAEPRQWGYEHTPLIAAFKEVDPTFDPAAETASVSLGNWERFYRMLLLLASGIQMAGPTLNPSTFAAALQQTRFPNPEHPLNAGRVGFDDRDHTMTQDYGELWWGETAPSPYSDDSVGTFCYVDEGRRRSPPAWPTGDAPFFRGPCHSGTQGPGPER